MKAAIFVEGQTEAIFVRELILELAGRETVAITEEKYHGGSFYITVTSNTTLAHSEVLIANCASDSRVATAIRERYNGLVSAGYKSIIGLRDLFPEPQANLALVQQAVASVIPTAPVPANVFIAVMEVEAWFIEEETHFSRISPTLTQQKIALAVNYDIFSGQSELIQHPASLLHEIYKIANLAYKKSKNHVNRTVNNLDFANLYINCRQRSASLNDFIAALEAAVVPRVI